MLGMSPKALLNIDFRDFITRQVSSNDLTI